MSRSSKQSDDLYASDDHPLTFDDFYYIAFDGRQHRHIGGLPDRCPHPYHGVTRDLDVGTDATWEPSYRSMYRWRGHDLLAWADECEENHDERMIASKTAPSTSYLNTTPYPGHLHLGGWPKTP